MEYEIILTRPALRDLEGIRRYIAVDNLTAADSFVSRILDETESLARFPERGGLLPERPGVRFVMQHPYLIVYRIVEESRTVRVLRFWHGARERIRMRLEP